MQSEPNTTELGEANESSGITSHQKKQVLVVLLLCGLLMAILTQPDRADSEQGAVVGTELPSDRRIVANPIALSENGEDLASDIDLLERLAIKRELSRLALEEIADLEILAPRSGEENNNAVSLNRRVQAIYQTTTGHAALLDNSIVRDGQTLPEGGTILNITTDGIEVSH